jgi:peptide deformylase
MALLPILHHPDPRLRRRALPVATVDDALRSFIANMFETMYAAPGIGLAATQVNDLRRVIVVDISENHEAPLALINPEVIAKEGEEEMEEGCLSVPGIYDKVQRAEHIRVRALNEQGETIEFDANGLLAICIQHEIDHLDGKLFVDYLSKLKQTRIIKKLEKHARETL